MSASARFLRQDECLACQAIWAGDAPQHAHGCLACPACHERPIGVAVYVGAYCYRCGWREGDIVDGDRVNDIQEDRKQDRDDSRDPEGDAVGNPLPLLEG